MTATQLLDKPYYASTSVLRSVQLQICSYIMLFIAETVQANTDQIYYRMCIWSHYAVYWI